MGKCPEWPSPSPAAVVGTFPYNLLNGACRWGTAFALWKLNNWERGEFDAPGERGER